MQTIKTLVVLLVLGGVGYGVHVIMNKPPGEMPVEVAGQTEEDWRVNIEMGGFPSPGTSRSQASSAPGSALPDRPTPLPERGQPVVSESNAFHATPNPIVANPYAPPSGALPPEHGPSAESHAHNHNQSHSTEAHGTEEQHLDHPGSDFSHSLSVDPFDTAWAAVVRNLENNDLATALFTLTPLINKKDLTSQQQTRVRELADQLAGTVIYSRDYNLEPLYTVQTGETLEQIAQHYKVSPQFLARINGIEAPFILLPGEQLKVVTGPFTAELNRERREMVLYLQRYYAGRFVISLGPDAPTVSGTHQITEMQPGRAYFGQGYEIPASDARNPYGQYWIGLGGSVGIHEMQLNDSYRTAGSIAMTPADVADAYILFTRDSRVIVR